LQSRLGGKGKLPPILVRFCGGTGTAIEAAFLAVIP